METIYLRNIAKKNLKIKNSVQKSWKKVSGANLGEVHQCFAFYRLPNMSSCYSRVSF